MASSLVLILASIVFVSATELKWGFTTSEYPNDNLEEKMTTIFKGWNLIQGFADPNFIISGTIKPSNIKAIFAFNPGTKDYARIYPNPERTSVDALPPAILQLPFWVYSDKAGQISYKTEKLDANFKITWPAGWNFISISSDMTGKSLNQIKGTCNYEKIYAYENKEYPGSWVEIESSTMDKTTFLDNNLGMGLVIKFTSECKLGTVSIGETITPPPAIP